MDLDDYVQRAIKTAIFPRAMPKEADPVMVPLFYCALKLNGEAGEVAEEIGKALRDDGGEITPERRVKLEKELGDVLWYWASLCEVLGITASTVAQANLEKLADRAARGKLGGSGSSR